MRLLLFFSFFYLGLFSQLQNNDYFVDQNFEVQVIYEQKGVYLSDISIDTNNRLWAIRKPFLSRGEIFKESDSSDILVFPALTNTIKLFNPRVFINQRDISARALKFYKKGIVLVEKNELIYLENEKNITSLFEYKFDKDTSISSIQLLPDNNWQIVANNLKNKSVFIFEQNIATNTYKLTRSKGIILDQFYDNGGFNWLLGKKAEKTFIADFLTYDNNFVHSYDAKVLQDFSLFSQSSNFFYNPSESGKFFIALNKTYSSIKLFSLNKEKKLSSLSSLFRVKDKGSRILDFEFSPNGFLYLLLVNDKYKTTKILRILPKSQLDLNSFKKLEISDSELLKNIKSENIWLSNQAWKGIARHNYRGVIPELFTLLIDDNESLSIRLRALWALEGLNEFNLSLWTKLLVDKSMLIRRQAIRSLIKLEKDLTRVSFVLKELQKKETDSKVQVGILLYYLEVDSLSKKDIDWLMMTFYNPKKIYSSKILSYWQDLLTKILLKNQDKAILYLRDSKLGSFNTKKFIFDNIFESFSKKNIMRYKNSLNLDSLKSNIVRYYVLSHLDDPIMYNLAQKYFSSLQVIERVERLLESTIQPVNKLRTLFVSSTIREIKSSSTLGGNKAFLSLLRYDKFYIQNQAVGEAVDYIKNLDKKFPELVAFAIYNYIELGYAKTSFYSALIEDASLSFEAIIWSYLGLLLYSDTSNKDKFIKELSFFMESKTINQKQKLIQMFAGTPETLSYLFKVLEDETTDSIRANFIFFKYILLRVKELDVFNYSLFKKISLDSFRNIQKIVKKIAFEKENQRNKLIKKWVSYDEEDNKHVSLKLGLVVFQSLCLSCHNPKNNLFSISLKDTYLLSSKDLVENILLPNKKIRQTKHQAFFVQLKSGIFYIASLIEKKGNQLSLFVNGRGLIVVAENEVVYSSFFKSHSFMPSGSFDYLESQQVVDLIQYLKNNY